MAETPAAQAQRTAPAEAAETPAAQAAEERPAANAEEGRKQPRTSDARSAESSGGKADAEDKDHELEKSGDLYEELGQVVEEETKHLFNTLIKQHAPTVWFPSEGEACASRFTMRPRNCVGFTLFRFVVHFCLSSESRACSYQ